MAFLVGQSAREIGIRIALGATEMSVLSLVLRQGMGIAGTGALLGLLLGAVMTRLMGSLLFGVPETDGVTFAGALLLLLGSAFTAIYLPARRAARTDPIESLRLD